MFIRKIVSAIALMAMLGACSTAGGMYSEGDPVNGQFSGWKTAGAVLLGIVTLGAVGAAAYAGAADAPAYSPTTTVHCTSNRLGYTVYTDCR